MPSFSLYSFIVLIQMNSNFCSFCSYLFSFDEKNICTQLSLSYSVTEMFLVLFLSVILLCGALEQGVLYGLLICYMVYLHIQDVYDPWGQSQRVTYDLTILAIFYDFHAFSRKYYIFFPFYVTKRRTKPNFSTNLTKPNIESTVVNRYELYKNS